MKRSTLYKIALTGLSLVTVTVFQNCGKLDIKNVDSSSLATSGSAELADDGSQPISLNPPAEPTTTVTDTDEPTPMQPIKAGPGLSSQPGLPTPISLTPETDIVVTTAPAAGSVEAKAIALCDSKVLLNTMTIVDISNFAGSLQFNAVQVKSVTNILGAVLLRAVNKDSVVQQISNISANDAAGEKAVVLCNFNDVKQISNINGAIILVNSHVTTLSDHKGKLTLINSQVDKISNHIGELVSLVAAQ